VKIDKKYLRKVVKEIIAKTDKSEENLLKISSILDILNKLFKENQTFRNIVLNPKASMEDKEKLMEKVLSALGADAEISKLLIKIVKDKKANIFKELNKVFKFEVEKFLGTIQGEIISAYKIDEALLNEIKSVVESKTGKKVKFAVKEDSSLIGGAVIKAGSYIIDTSVKSYLKRLESTLSRF
jgi:F-type H+-transporting ATPase subunit delta